MEIILDEIIEDYNHYLSQVVNGCKDIVNNITKENISEALKMIIDFSEGMLWLESATNYFNTQRIDTRLDINKIKPLLLDVNEGLENQDFMLVSDIFQYEIVPFFEQVYLISRDN